MAKRFDLYYGAPGCGKTRSIIELIEAVHKDTGKKARVYVGDGSYEMYNNSGLVEDSIIELAQFNIRDNPFTTSQQIAEGFFPADPLDPKSVMVKPSADVFAKVGMWVYEGCAVMGQYMMGDAKGGLAQRAADGEVLGQDANVRIIDNDEYKFAGNSGAHYNIGQRQLHTNILRSKALPGLVVWTTHERMDDGERGGAFSKGQVGDKVRLTEKVIGPELIGKALTSTIARDFGNTLHFMQVGKKEGGQQDITTGKTAYVDKEDFRIYTNDHYDPEGIVGLKYVAVARAMDPTAIKAFYSSPASVPGKGLLDFYGDLEKANKRRTK